VSGPDSIEPELPPASTAHLHTHADGTVHAPEHAPGPTDPPSLYRGFPPRSLHAGRVFHGIGVDVPAPGRPMLARLREAFAAPFQGLTSDGCVRRGLYPLQHTGASSAPIVDAAQAYLRRLRRRDFRRLALEPLTSPDRLRWINAFPDWMPTGLWLADLEADERAAALDVIGASLSTRGFAQTRDAMRVNQALGEFIGHSNDSICEHGYFFTIFGEPSATTPWGWRLMGYHLVIYCTLVGSQMVLTPAFVGAEMAEIETGPYAGTSVLQEEQRGGLELASSLSAAQRARAVLHPSMNRAELPSALSGLDGRHLAGAGQDNRIIPYEGLPAESLSAGQRARLLALMDLYIGRQAEPFAAQRRAEVRQSLDATHFAWIGDPDRVPFYYRIHSPVILIEFDHHSGVFIASDQPEPFHIHTIVRTPNGNDYGLDLLRQHYALFDHPTTA